MEYLNKLFISIAKKLKIKSHLFIIFILITISNSLILELKPISIPYLSLRENITNSKLRHLSEQYVYGSTFKLNYYYSNLYLGEKMEKQGYILDTGSSITTSTCSPICTKCGHHICPPYNISSEDKIISCYDVRCRWVTSKCSINNHKCSFSISYSEGSSLRGVYINEIVRFGENYKEQNGTYVPIGCTNYENHLFFKQDANGIMGLANNEHNFIDILYKSGAIKTKLFSLCFAQLGGVFNIGEINTKIHKENISYVPMLLDRGKYFGLTIKSIAVNDKNIECFSSSKYNVFIDSGTTISYFKAEIFDEILKIMKEECKKFDKENACGTYSFHSDYGHCFYYKSLEDLDYAVNNYWPIINFYLEGYNFKWKAKNYVFNISTPEKPGACMGMNKAYGNKITLGSSWIIGHDVIFDKDNHVIGFAEAECYQNKLLNNSNGLELNDDIINKIKEENINIINNSAINSTMIQNLIFSRNKNIENKLKTFENIFKIKIDNPLDIILISSIFIIIVLFFFIVILGIKCYKQKKLLENLETKTEVNKNEFSKNIKSNKYIEVNDNHLKESNTLDIV